MKRGLFLILISVLAGAAGALYVDRLPDYRPLIDRVVSPLLPVDESLVSSSGASLSEAELEQWAIEPCFARSQAFDEVPPVWMERMALGPLSSQRTPTFQYPNLDNMPGLVKLEQILSSGGNQRHHCAATRIAEHWFLTANHCVLMRGTSTEVVDMILVGPREDVMQAESIIVPVAGAVCHSAWFSQTGKFDDDLALVYVEDVGPLHDVKIATMDSSAAPLPPSVYDTAYFAGWGKNGDNRFLQGGSLTVSNVGETFIMTDNGGEFAPCVGDSGGPLYVYRDGRPRVVGVLSSVTTDACPPFDRAFYMRLKTFEGWIRTTMKICEQKGQFVCGSFRFGA